MKPESDRELLELAAKAAGIELRWPNVLDTDLGPRTWPELHSWNPLTESGDALDLAVKLNLCLIHTGHGVQVSEAGCRSVIEPSSPDPYAATRRAIVRAAAALAAPTKDPA